MEYRKLGTTDKEVSVMAIGCWPFAGGVAWGEQDDGQSIATVHAALDAGINFFDTAEGYEEGHSERVLGRGLAERRHEVVVATKVSPNHLTASGIAAARQAVARSKCRYVVRRFADALATVQGLFTFSCNGFDLKGRRDQRSGVGFFWRGEDLLCWPLFDDQTIFHHN